MLDNLKQLYDSRLYENIEPYKNCTYISIDKDISDDKFVRIGKFLTFHKKTPTRLYRNKVGNNIFLMVEYRD